MKKVCVVGSINMDIFLRVESIPVIGETVLAREIFYGRGGKGENQAIAMSRLGCDVEMIGCVGDDENGKILLEKLKSDGVGVCGVEVVNFASGTAYINVDDKGNNNIIVHPGANHKLGFEMIEAHADIIKNSDIAVFQLEIPVDVVKKTIEICHKNKICVILNPAPAVLEFDYEMLRYVDYLIPNETELELIAKEKVNEKNIVEVCKKILEKGVKNLIVTLGEKGSILVNEKGYKKFDIIEVDVKNTTGAGDSFIGGFVKGLLDEKNIEEAVLYATKVSALTVTKKGASESFPSIDEVNSFKIG